jgi:2-C-methyl-D-erythritol 4-phosphate cytidylyltransferase
LSQLRTWAVVPAAGVGMRMGADRPKQYLELAGRPVLAHALEALLAEPRIEALVLVVAQGDLAWRQVAGDDPRVLEASGGAERCHSVLAGLERLAGQASADDWVVVHDAARPCVSPEEIARLLSALQDEPSGVLLALPLADTLKRATPDGRVQATVPRRSLWRALTPQAFRYGLLAEALAESIDAGALVTDEAAAMERAGHRPKLVRGSAQNIKITGPEDLALAEAILAARGKGI